jgi:hypothetical protein
MWLVQKMVGVPPMVCILADIIFKLTILKLTKQLIVVGKLS